MKTYWLILSVFLFYNDLAVLVLSISNYETDKIQDSLNSQAISDTKAIMDDVVSFGDIPTQMVPDVISTHIFINEDSCDKWEFFDGSQCVCADMMDSKCAGEIGMVCDDNGGRHDSLCDFANEMCHGRLPLERSLVSCGVCDVLKLEHDKKEDKPNDKHENAEEFELQDPKNRTHLVYVSTTSQLMIFFEKTMNRWVVGELRGNEPSIAMVQLDYAEFPQDHQAAMLAATSTDSGIEWEVHPTLTVKCVNRSLKKNRRRKRFIFTLIAIAVAAATTAYALRKVQEKKGCLYYPSVCRLRDELKNDIEPEVKQLQSTFKKAYGDIAKFKDEVEQTTDVVMDIKDRLVDIRELHVELDTGLRQLTGIVQDMPDRFPDLGNAIAGYEQWSKAMKDSDLIREISFRLDIMTTVATIPSLMGASVGFFTLAGAGLGAVATIAFAVVDIVSSIKEEKKVKNDLEKAKSTYLKAKSDLLNAFAKMESFQKEFCKTTINFLQQVSETGQNYHQLFKSLNQAIKLVYVSSPENCNNKDIYMHTIEPVMKDLRIYHLRPLADYLANNVKELKEKITNVNEMDQFLKNINDRVQNDRVDPTQLFDSFKHTKPALAEQQFKTLYDLLVYISVKCLPTDSCYWGVNLEAIRSGTLTKNNYLKSPVCKSPEISSLTDIIKERVSKTDIPCDIFNMVKGDVFRTRYLVIWYIADYVLPDDTCYWGINIAEAQSMSIYELEQAKLSTTIFSALEMFSNGGINEQVITTMRSILCGQHLICSEGWQNFLMCASWKNKDSNNLLNCPDASLGSKCIPPKSPVQTCSYEL